MESFQYTAGTSPLLISMPHCSSNIPEEVKQRMTEIGRSSIDSDWFVDKLYEFAAIKGVHIIKPMYSRFYIDLNRDPSGINLYPGASSTELCPTTSFDGDVLYLQGEEPTDIEIEQRIATAWQPYHQKIQSILAEIKALHGHAILFDAHSIRSQVPRFFEGVLPDFNFGTNSGVSCSQDLIEKLESIDLSPWSRVTNGRFKGGYIIREYSDLSQNIETLQLEMSQRIYMDEVILRWDQQQAEPVIAVLKTLISCLQN